jgi:hypothetical protein
MGLVFLCGNAFDLVNPQKRRRGSLRNRVYREEPHAKLWHVVLRPGTPRDIPCEAGMLRLTRLRQQANSGDASFYRIGFAKKQISQSASFLSVTPNNRPACQAACGLRRAALRIKGYTFAKTYATRREKISMRIACIGSKQFETSRRRAAACRGTAGFDRGVRAN